MAWGASARPLAKDLRILGRGARFGRLHLAAGRLFFTDAGAGSGGGPTRSGRIASVAGDGGPVSTVMDGLRCPLALHVDPNGLTVCDQAVTVRGPRSYRIQHLAFGPSSANEGKVLLEGPFGPDRILRQASRMLWTNPGEGRIEALDLVTGDLETLHATSAYRPMHLTVTGHAMYWVETHRQTLERTLVRRSLRAARDERLVQLRTEATGIIASYAADDEDLVFERGAALTLLEPDGGCCILASTSGPAHHIALDGAWVYWSDAEGLHRVRRAGGGRESLFRAPVVRFVADGDIYWVGDGRIFGLRPPSRTHRNSTTVPRP